MSLLVIDNYDSYPYILHQYLWELTGKEPTIVKNDHVFSTLSHRELCQFQAVVLSPGPGSPSHPRDVGEIPKLLGLIKCPVLGVCLGHQILAHLSGCPVSRAPQPYHGKESWIRHRNHALFAGIPSCFLAVRYHSLVVSAVTSESEMEVIAHSQEDSLVMALADQQRPRFGVQFHPESIGTQHGKRLLRNFLTLAGVPTRSGSPATFAPPFSGGETSLRKKSVPPTSSSQSFSIPWVDPELFFVHFFAETPNSFWLDSSDPARAYLSYQGFGERSWWLYSDRIEERMGGTTHVRVGDPFERMAEMMREKRKRTRSSGSDRFRQGWVGFLRYEAGQSLFHNKQPGGTTAGQNLPDPHSSLGTWVEPSVLVEFDHHRQQIMVRIDSDPRQENWEKRIREATPADFEAYREFPFSPDSTLAAVDDQWADDLEDDSYRHAVEVIQEQLRAGQAYEVCLTRRMEIPAPGNSLSLYRHLRRKNPAPYSAFLQFGSQRELKVFCSSPERFLRLNCHGLLSSSPIKGTQARNPHPDLDAIALKKLLESPKDRSENLMIVDLIRNDFGRVCQPGSVRVARFMECESYATVHQLVSEIHGTLRSGFDIWDAIGACFPGGSMTGAPKARAMELIHQLEKSARGIYSGTLGWIDSSGTADLNIVIRTMVEEAGRLQLGSGGAVVSESTPEQELQEAKWKANAVTQVFPTLKMAPDEKD